MSPGFEVPVGSSTRGGRGTGMRLSLWVCVVGLILVCSELPTTLGLHEDQAGTWDWYKQFVGEVTSAVFSTGSSKKRAYVITEENVVAAVNLREGEIAWRHVFPEDDKVERLIDMPSNRQILTLSAMGRNVRAWSSMEGTLLWEAGQYNPTTPPVAGGTDLIALEKDYDGDDYEDFMTLANGLVQLRSSVHGSLIWNVNITSALEDTVYEGTAVYKLVRCTKKNVIHVFGISADAQSVVLIDLQMSEGFQEPQVQTPRAAASEVALSATMA
eukprot:CAMPEP_0118946662 /NCGR_PEP_ID=MMETSP1169-20130426/44598_1 /TAXON_ID=36882 /ORGANISM="Pyramimonas obovata, Strain CCMP722" /LENGTH=270 /DNA_ID=CAMNT_0006892691 /DNA_START=185 /DNA_END=993 /DNA_ORIENTATION=-